MNEQKSNETQIEKLEEELRDAIPQLENRFRITIWNRLVVLLKWLVFATLTGLALGLVGTAFGKGVSMATAFRMAHSWILYSLPFAGVLIVWMYKWERKQERSSTNMVLDAIHAEREIPLKTAPLIFISTILTHLFGGSAGREGAALQLGGSIGNFLGRVLRIDENDRRVMIMAGMSAAFSALFGTPMAAAVFSMEVVSVGIMHYAALVPCVIASYVAYGVACHFGLTGERFALGTLPEFNIMNAGKILFLGFCCAAVSILFCVVLHKTEELFAEKIKNSFLRPLVSGILIIGLTLLLGTTDYLGTGMQVVERAVVDRQVIWCAFLLKIIFTAITLSGGFKGGEIVPTFFVGATFGCLMGQILHISPSLAAACGMAAVFCGVTNSPISSLLISLEMFGFEGAPFYFIAIAISYMQSGYYGLYRSQKIMYSKVKTTFINRNAKE
ncbi:chloride channel protein [Anaerosacchariphilus sp. NSJ-68]|uniref:Chloride channel protein n=2 Tax=Lachnospiraceae TaxID=186803 RepID=A0A923RMW8_9FIRM|nr:MULTISPECIES: chloride channel protein [Lachnospiraceae]MBC5659891.1 chloride channel protein [Anaerosacchariphilus hominis]MBC5697558.1 chloride channel protein [Roseburia difficilis]